MLLSFVALAAAAVSVQAFQDTSPFILFSNSPLPASFQDVSTSQLQSKERVISSAKRFLADCPSQIYYIVSQPGVSFNDLSSSAAHLKNALSNPAVHARFTVSEVVGLNATDADFLEVYLQTECGAKTADVSDIKSALEQRTGTQGSSVIVRERYPSIPSNVADRQGMIVDADASLYPVLNELPKGYKYTFIYTTSPAVSQEADHTEMVRYESDFNEVFHMDLKRNLQARKGNATAEDMRPLFEKYEFFNPGLFMGLLVTLLLLSILSVGMSALGSLQVSYGAFDKEMGPSAQKKQ